MFVSLYAAEASVVFVVGMAILLMVFQAQSVSRRRMVGAVVLVLVAVTCKVLADGDVPVGNPCKDVDPNSWLWWFLGCWSLPSFN
jgi:Ca2+/Na+ antiporter